MLPKELWGFIGTLVTVIATAIVSTWTIIRTRRQDFEARTVQEAERTLVPRAQLDIECLFYGPEQGHFIADIRVIVENKGLLLARYSGFLLRVRGLKADAPLKFLNDKTCRLRFPDLLVREELLPNEPGSDYYTYTIEPGIKQVFTFATKIPENTKYIVVFVMLTSRRDRIPSVDTPPDAREYREERLFAVAASEPSRK